MRSDGENPNSTINHDLPKIIVDAFNDFSTQIRRQILFGEHCASPVNLRKEFNDIFAIVVVVI